MIKLLKILLIFTIFLISIYMTNYSMNTLREQDEIMLKIRNTTSKYNKSYTNAVIKDNTITPGEYGKEIDYIKSYNSMKEYGMYNESLTKLKDTKPTISIEDNYDKYIESGNDSKKQVSLIIKLKDKIDFSYLKEVLIKTNTPITIFVDGTLLETNLNDIKKLNNNELEILSYDGKVDEVFFKTSISYLNNITNTKVKYCYTDEENIKLLNMCSKEKLHTIKGKNIIKNNIYKNIKNNLYNGNILVIDTTNFKELKIAIDYIKSKGYEIKKLDCLLSEKVC